MNLTELLKDKDLKAKAKVETISEWLLSGQLTESDWCLATAAAKEADKANCIEAMEFATQKQPDILSKDGFALVSETLTAKAPRVKWESAKVIGNTARLFTNQLDTALKNLLDNAHHEGTVVRWSAAFALGEIVKLKLPLNTDLIPALEAISAAEEKNSIRKIYQSAFKKVK
jgi:HEAT repeat protein